MSEGKVYAVTGATGCIGYEIARLLAVKRKGKGENSVVLFCRNEKKAASTVKKLIQQTGNKNVSYLIADLGLKGDITALRKKWGDRKLDCLILNHVICPVNRVETKDGIEMNMAVNILGYFWLTEAFMANLHLSSQNGVPSSVVNVVSYWAGRLKIDDLEFKKRRYDVVDAYYQCKQGERMLTQYYAQFFVQKKLNIVINSSMSGDVDSKCSRDLGSPTEAAKTPYMVATGQFGEKTNGCYFEDCEKGRLKNYEKDWKAIKQLYDICSKY